VKINIAELKKQTGLVAQFDFSERIDHLYAYGQRFSFPRPAHLRVVLTNTGKSFIADFRLEVDLHAVCGRCLEEYEKPLRLQFTEEYVQGEPREDTTALSYMGDVIDLREAVRENILLNLPLKPICDEECKGLCSECGVNLNLSTCSCGREEVDLRWADLLKLGLLPREGSVTDGGSKEENLKGKKR